jgi:GrpB-like predicted nucleotidyltransferase (UPF0157 family)
MMKHLKDQALAIEHYGSTSVPGLSAKPILDILIIMPDSDHALDDVKSTLSIIGYDHEGDLGISGREAFKNRDRKAPYDGNGTEWPTHYLYVCNIRAPVVMEFLAFRDYLRLHPEDTSEYSRVKMEAAERYLHNIEGYMAYKKECAGQILEKAQSLKGKVSQYLDSVAASANRPKTKAL